MTAERRDAIRAGLGEAGLDALLVTGAANVRYLTGFTGSNGAVLVLESEDVLVTDFRYEEQAARESPGVRVWAEPGGLPASVAEVTGGALRLGIEAGHLSVAALRALEERMPEAALVETRGVVEGRRIVKDEGEIAAIRRACAIADEALTVLLGSLREGMTEREAADILEDAMRAGGSECPSFDSIVAFGPSAAEPHHRAAGRRLARGDMVKLDFGAVCDGYHSDMTRTVAFGEPDPRMAEVYELVRAGQAAGVAAVRHGAATADVDAAAREPIEAAGYDYGHGTGHGAGLEIHEAPAVARNAADILAAGMTVTVEPGIYLPGIGGVRIEDLVVVRQDGCEILTRSPKQLIKV